MLVAASGDQKLKYNEQVVTSCGETIKRHTELVVSAICYQVTHCAQCLQYSETISFPTFINLQCTYTRQNNLTK